jgi:hypothetical protein
MPKRNKHFGHKKRARIKIQPRFENPISFEKPNAKVVAFF